MGNKNKMKQNCLNCGAPLKYGKCEYCGSEFTVPATTEEAIEILSKPRYETDDFNICKSCSNRFGCNDGSNLSTRKCFIKKGIKYGKFNYV